MAEAALRTERLSKHFGGLVAVNDVSLEFFADQIHAVIGPNGAGKTTLASLLSGDLPCTSGHIYLDGEDIAGFSADRISQRGVGRSYQKTNIFLPFTAFENCRIAAQSRLTSSMRCRGQRPKSLRGLPWPESSSAMENSTAPWRLSNG